MRIIIVGAGSAGRSLAYRIHSLGHDLIVIDRDPASLTEIEAELDVLTIVGPGSSPAVLEKADVAKCDLLVAVTSSDEVNLVACHCARRAGVKHTIARLSEDSYSTSPLFDLKGFGVDQSISLYERCAEEIFSVLSNPGTFEWTTLLHGKIAAFGLKVPEKSPLLGKPLAEFKGLAQFDHVRFIGLMHDGQLQIPRGTSQCKAGDDLYAVLNLDRAEDFLNWVHGDQAPRYRKVIIAGATRLGVTLARMVESTSWELVLIEQDRTRAERASEDLGRTLVMNADPTHVATLKDIGLDAETAFVSVTLDEETNIVACIQAKEIGACFTVSRINRPEYVPIVDKLRLLDQVTSPYLSLIRAILPYARGETSTDVCLFYHIPGELQEVAIQPGNTWAGQALMNVDLPEASVVAAIERGEHTFVPTGEVVLKANDRLAVYSLPGTISRIRSIFS
jgi:trk system potassium uptake protein TrkA